jgi:membrane-associated phospholipid phosphatase
MVEQLDDAAARLALSVRRRPGPNRAMYALSALGDDGRVWIAAAVAESLRARRPMQTFGHAMLWLGIESALVNGPMKIVVHRPRPDAPTEHEHRLRIPSGTSFPSGHAASAATMATVLSMRSPLAPLWYLLAVGVGASRVHVGVHHASDVLAGWAVGAAIGSVGRRFHPARDCTPTEAP